MPNTRVGDDNVTVTAVWTGSVNKELRSAMESKWTLPGFSELPDRISMFGHELCKWIYLNARQNRSKHPIETDHLATETGMISFIVTGVEAWRNRPAAPFLSRLLPGPERPVHDLLVAANHDVTASSTTGDRANRSVYITDVDS